ncbi:hypothetical protein [Caballeronia sp. GAFFF2]|uniref:hypothetical protein n=1 Tax=Caballeronia sp. GAFFF2 TaxID=2921741 RepID=UPI002028D227|nr:hypothetical protein [Caballeronia sp. GAFFF2]
MNARPNFNDEFSKARAALAYLDLADRDIWVKAAMALKSEFGDSAKENVARSVGQLQQLQTKLSRIDVEIR